MTDMDNSKFSIMLIVMAFTLIPENLICQKTSDGSMPQYYFPDFTAGKVKMKSGQIQTPILNYNTVTEKMVFIRDGKYYDISNPEMVDTVILQDIRFVPVGKAFYEVLMPDNPSLYIQFKGELLPAGKPAGYGGTSQLASSTYLSSVALSSGRYNLPIPSDYIVRISQVFWIRKDTEWFSFINEKQFLNLFPDKADKLKAFIKKNHIKTDRKEQIIELVKYCNSLF